MADNTELPKDQAGPASKDIGHSNDKAAKSILVGFCSTGMNPIFAEPIANNNGKLPEFDDSTKGVRLVGLDGTEHRFFIPQIWVCFEGAMGEVKKYLYNVSVDWTPQEIDKSRFSLTARRPFQEDLVNYLKNKGSQPRAGLPIHPGMPGYP